MAENRTDIAIATAEAIGELIANEIEDGDQDMQGLTRAGRIVGTFIAALRLQQGPRVGRPRKPKAEA